MTEPDPFSLQPSLRARAAEAKRLLAWARLSASALVVGVSGVGKSNLLLHLADPATQAAALGDQAADTLIARVNLQYAPDFSDRTVFSLILDALEGLAAAGHPALGAAEGQRLAALHDRLLDADHDTLRIQRAVRQAIAPLLAEPSRRLVLLFDQADDLYREAAPRLFVNLRGLREAFKSRLSFVLFTRDVLDNLAPPDSARDELAELLADQTLGLGPLDRQGTEDQLRRIAARYGLSPSDLVVDRLYAATGGHAGLLRAAYLAAEGDPAGLRGLVRGGAPVGELAAALLAVAAVERECRQVWRGLPLAEQSYLASLVAGVPESPPAAVLANLKLKGLLVPTEPPRVFAPILAAYIAQQPHLWRDEFVYDEARRAAVVRGQPISLSPLHSRLLLALWERRGQLVTRDELISAGWPNNETEGLRDQSLTQEISRLREKIEPDDENPRYLITVPGSGYRLVTAPATG